MYVLTWFAGTEPTLTPVIRPEVYAEAIEKREAHRLAAGVVSGLVLSRCP